MKVMIDLCVVPMGVGVSVSEYVTLCQKIIQKAGLSHHMHAFGTNIEGEWDDVFAVVKSCHEAVHRAGADRVTTSMRVGTRVDREQTIEDKIESVNRKLASS